MSTKQFESKIAQLETDLLFVIDSSLSKKEYVQLDLSKDNLDLEKVNVSSSEELGAYVNQQIKNNNGQLAFGGYLETRAIYERSEYFREEAHSLDERNIHLGIDFWHDAGTNVLAVLDAEVHSFKNNLNHGDYGPTIILTHQIDNFEFFTLYGHLSLESLSGLEVGKKVKRGDVIAELGSSEVNGDYPPHLHFQCILDLEDYFGDYPGVASRNTLEFYRNNCPDPSLLLGLSL